MGAFHGATCGLCGSEHVLMNAHGSVCVRIGGACVCPLWVQMGACAYACVSPWLLSLWSLWGCDGS